MVWLVATGHCSLFLGRWIIVLTVSLRWGMCIKVLDMQASDSKERFVGWCGLSCILLPSVAVDFRGELERLSLPGTGPRQDFISKHSSHLKWFLTGPNTGSPYLETIRILEINCFSMIQIHVLKYFEYLIVLNWTRVVLSPSCHSQLCKWQWC